MDKEQQKKHLIDMMEQDEKLGLYDEPKQETLEQAAEKYCLINNIPVDTMIVKNDRSCEFETPISMLIKGAKWQEQRMYSEEDMKSILQSYADWSVNGKETYSQWFEQFKKK